MGWVGLGIVSWGWLALAGVFRSFCLILFFWGWVGVFQGKKLQQRLGRISWMLGGLQLTYQGSCLPRMATHGFCSFGSSRCDCGPQGTELSPSGALLACIGLTWFNLSKVGWKWEIPEVSWNKVLTLTFSGFKVVKPQKNPKTTQGAPKQGSLRVHWSAAENSLSSSLGNGWDDGSLHSGDGPDEQSPIHL